MKLYRSYRYIVFMAVLLMPMALWAQMTQNSRNLNTCYIDGFERTSDLSFKIYVNLSNVDTLSGFQLPFSFDLGQVDVVCDSVSFADGRCEYFEMCIDKIDNEAKVVLLNGIAVLDPEGNTPDLAPGDGRIATVYFTASQVDYNSEIVFRASKFPHSGIDFRFFAGIRRLKRYPVNLSLNQLD